MTLAEEFRTWALDPRRTNDELFTAELLAEAAEELDRYRNKIWHTDYAAERERAKRRRLNPAYRPQLGRARLDLVVELWREIKQVKNDTIGDEDRPVRDLSALRFFPHLTSLKLCSSLRDLAPLRVLPGLKLLELHDDVLAELGPLMALTELEDVTLRLEAPWPSLSSLGALPKLTKFRYTGNLLVLDAIGTLLFAERVWLHKGHSANTPLRDADDLPALPRVKHLWVDGLAELRGIERFATVEHLNLHGPFVELGPLAVLPEVRELKLGGELFLDVQPLARMPRLRTLDLWRHRGLDVSSLTESPRLRRVEAPLTEAMKTDLAALNAAIGFVDEGMFAAEAPAPAPRVRFIAYDPQRADYKSLPPELHRRASREAAFDDDPLTGPAEERWFTRQLAARLDALLDRGWGRFHAYVAGGGNLTIRRFEDVLQLREIVAAVHATIAGARFPWDIMLIVEPHGDLSEDMDEIAERHGGDDQKDADYDREREDWEESRQRWREERDFLEREHRHRLREQDGLPIKPEEFAPPPPPPPPETEGDVELEDERAPKEPRGLGADFQLRLDLGRDFVWVHADEAQRAADYLRVKFEDWHALPGPPEARPRPR